MKAALALLVAAQALAPPPNAAGQVPSGYPAETVAAARKEGKLVVYSTTDVSAATPLNRAFEAGEPAGRSRVPR